MKNQVGHCRRSSLMTGRDMPVRFSTFPRTKAPPPFVAEAVSIFSSKIGEISTVLLAKGLTSDEVLSVLRCELEHVGFDVETGKRADQKIKRPVFFGECIFRDIRPPIPTTSAHLYRGIRPALTRCREALVFDISFLAFRHVVEGLSFGRIVRRVRAGRRCAPAGRGWHLRRWVHQ